MSNKLWHTSKKQIKKTIATYPQRCLFNHSFSLFNPETYKQQKNKHKKKNQEKYTNILQARVFDQSPLFSTLFTSRSVDILPTYLENNCFLPQIFFFLILCVSQTSIWQLVPQMATQLEFSMAFLFDSDI